MNAITPVTTNLERLVTYCAQDVRTEIAADEVLPRLSPHEFEVWRLDQHINDRGVPIDVELVERCAELCVIAQKNADKRMRELTGGAVGKCTETSKLVAWINSRGIPCQSVKKGDQEELIEFASILDDDAVIEAIDLRKAAAKTSTAKFLKILHCICSDGRARGLLNYHGAGPGRWAGRLIQPQNLPRVDWERDGTIIEAVLTVVLGQAVARTIINYSNFTAKEITAFTKTADVTPYARHTHDILECAVGPVLPALSKSLRACIKAPRGKKLVGGDFSNIEGRINAWLAGETWKIEAFKAYDAGTGPDLYKVGASRILGKDVKDITKNERQVQGKVPELACGYQGGVGAFITMGYTQSPPVRPADLVRPVQAAATAEEWAVLAKSYPKAQDKFGLTEAQWIAIKYIVTSWRKRNPAIVAGWWEVQDAAISAVDNPGSEYWCYGNRVAYMSDGAWLYCRLPSGRIMHYCQPYIKESVRVLVNKDGEEYEKWVRTVHFYGIDSTTKQWRVKALYGGLQCENIVQGTARCVMDRAMFRVERAGYPLILTVHDELLSEVPIGFGSPKHYQDTMSVQDEDWMQGLPLSADAWEDERYVK